MSDNQDYFGTLKKIQIKLIIYISVILKSYPKNYYKPAYIENRFSL